MVSQWRNRIVGYGLADPEQLLANSYNWKIHGTEQQEAIDAVLDSVGWVGCCLVNTTTQRLFDGHLRCQRAIRRGEKEVPVLYCELSENEELLVLATLDPIGQMYHTDKQMFDEVLHEINTTDAGLLDFLGELAEKEKLYRTSDRAEAPKKKPAVDAEKSSGSERFGVLVILDSQEEQRWLLDELEDRSFNCKPTSQLQ